MGKSEESSAQALLAVNLDQMLLPELDYLMIELIEVAQALQTPVATGVGGATGDAAQQARSTLKAELLEKMRLTAMSVHRARQSQQEMERASQRGVLTDWSKLSG